MRTLPFLLILLLALPQAASAAFASDPAGDEGASTPYRVAVVPTTCHDPRIDLLAAGVASDGSNVTITMTVLDLAGRPTCGNGAVWMDARFGLWWFPLHDSAGHSIIAYADADYGQLRMHYAVGSSDWVGGPAAGTINGNVLTWVIPLSGLLPGTNESYDYRGLSFQTQVEAHENLRGVPSLGQGDVTLYDRLELGPVAV